MERSILEAKTNPPTSKIDGISMKHSLLRMSIAFCLFYANPSLGDDQKWDEDKLVSDFVESNLIWITLHETTHLLIEEMKINVLGSEEDAADNLATIAFLSLDLANDIQTIVQIAASWHFDHEILKRELEQLDQAPPYYADHRLGQQRSFQVICLAYGADPDHVRDLAELVELPEDRRDECVVTYDRLLRSWNDTLSSHVLGVSEKHVDVTFEYYEADNIDYEYLTSFIEEKKILERSANILLSNYRIPRKVVYRVQQCDAVNAYYDPSDNSVTICYELIDDLAKKVIEKTQP